MQSDYTNENECDCMCEYANQYSDAARPNPSHHRHTEDVVCETKENEKRETASNEWDGAKHFFSSFVFSTCDDTHW